MLEKPKGRKRTLGRVCLALVVLLMGVHAIHEASGAAGDYAVFQPAEADGMWRVGQSLRICATEPPTGAGTLTAPDASTQSVVADAEGCFGVTPDAEGPWSLSWPVAGPAVRSVTFPTWGPEAFDVGFWVELLFWIAALAFTMYHGAWFAFGFVLTGSFHLMVPGWLWDLEAVLPYLLLAALAEWGGHRMKFRNRKK